MSFKEIGYEDNKVIQLDNLYHKVSRFGRVYDLVIEGFDGKFYQLSDYGCDYEALKNIFTIRHGDEVILYKIWDESNRGFYVVEDISFSTNYGDTAVCSWCGCALTEVLGSLCCPNTRCNGRSLNRVLYFYISVGRIFDDLFMLKEFVEIEVNTDTSIGRTISGSIYTLLMIENDNNEALVEAKSNLVHVLNSLNMACSALNIGDDFPSAVMIMEFISHMSIPCITRNDIKDGIIATQERCDVISIFSHIADLCVERGGDPDGVYQSDLRNMEEYVLTIHLYKDECLDTTRDVSEWE